MKKRDRRQEEPGSLWINVMCDLLKGGVLAGAIAVVALLLCAVLISAGLIRERWTEGAVMAVCVAGALVGGLYAVRKVGRRALFVGLGVGIILFLLLLTAGMLIYGTANAGQGTAGILCACLCGGGISGILGAPKKKQRR